jgi:hypothetical protein
MARFLSRRLLARMYCRLTGDVSLPVQMGFKRIDPALLPGVYRRISKGNPKFWPSDGAVGKYSSIEAHLVQPWLRFRPPGCVAEPGW